MEDQHDKTMDSMSTEERLLRAIFGPQPTVESVKWATMRIVEPPKAPLEEFAELGAELKEALADLGTKVDTYNADLSNLENTLEDAGKECEVRVELHGVVEAADLSEIADEPVDLDEIERTISDALTALRASQQKMVDARDHMAGLINEWEERRGELRDRAASVVRQLEEETVNALEGAWEHAQEYDRVVGLLDAVEEAMRKVEEA